MAKVRNIENAAVVLSGKSQPYLIGFLALIFCTATAFYCFAVGEKLMSINQATDKGLVRINQSKSTGGYSRFMIEMENLSDRPLSVDPYGSAFDPPRGVRTQRVGIGLPIKIGNQQIDMRNTLMTDPSQEAPVGSEATEGNADAIPDAALPAAAGAAAGAAAVGALLTGMAQGVKPREALNDLAGLISGNAGSGQEDLQALSDLGYQTELIKSYRDQDMTELDYQKQRLEAAKKQGALDVASDAEAAVKRLSRQIGSYDKNLAELGQKPLEHTEMEQRSFDYTRKDLAEEVREELADKAAGTISDTDRIGIDLWIADNAPTEQAYEDMKSLVDKMTVRTEEGNLIGDKRTILTNLGEELQRTNQPNYTYFENYSLREEVMESAKEGPLDTAKKIKDGINDFNETAETISPDAEKLEDMAKTRQEGWEKDGATPGGSARDAIDNAGKVIDAGFAIHSDSQGYMAAGNSRTLAVTKAVTQYGVDLGVNTLMDKNPVMKVVNTALKYSEPAIGKDISPGKGWRILTDKAFDSYTGELDQKGVDKLDFNSAEVKDTIRDGQAKGLEERLKSSGLSDTERGEVTARLKELRKT